MRGTPQVGGVIIAVKGIIPAYAGNTLPAVTSLSSSRDHPRVCGEHFSSYLLFIIYGGSSPRMRGTRADRIRAVSRAGIIPAYAGNTPSGLSSARNVRDHPRVCGEHKYFAIAFAPYSGSSPRMRGTLCGAGESFFNAGIIPAYAGNTDG